MRMSSEPAPGFLDRLARRFKADQLGSTGGQEVRAGVTTFLTMSYIIFVQPALLSQAGMDYHGVLIATCVASAAATLLMGLLANYPIALAPAMGHNAYFVFVVVAMNPLTGRPGHGITWQMALTAILISGLIFIIVAFVGLREKVMHAIPDSLKYAIAAGIGLLIALLGFKNSGLITSSPATLVQLGRIGSPGALLALFGLAVIALLSVLRVRGAILLGILLTAGAGYVAQPLFGLPESLVKAPERVIGLPGRPRVLLYTPKATAENATFARTCTDELKQQLEQSGGFASVTLVRPGETAGGQAPTFLMPIDPTWTLSEEEQKRETGKRLGLRKALARQARENAADIVIWGRIGDEAGKGQALRFRAIDGRPENTMLLLEMSSPSSSAAVPATFFRKFADGLKQKTKTVLQFDFSHLFTLGMIEIIFVFFFLDLFDTVGTLVGVGQQAGFMKDGKLPRARRALFSDAVGTVVGACLGTSTVTSYIESAVGVEEGGRTGLANMVTAALFLVAIVFSPIIAVIGQAKCVIAPVLILVGCVMMSCVRHIKWADATEAIPAFLTLVIIPLAFSITDGIAFGFIAYAFLKLVSRRRREATWVIYVFAVLFLLRYIFLLRG